jgi:hypothetical protein
MKYLDLPYDLVAESLNSLEFMARYKYDQYEMYAPGARFLIHLFSLLSQHCFSIVP